MRLFVALNLPDSEKQRLHEATAPLREAGLPVNWVDPDALHLTLKFLGQVRTEDLSRVQEGVNRVAVKSTPFEVGLQGFGAFPTLRRPRALWVGVEATPELRCLKHDLEWELNSLGFDREVRAFHPHITLGRATKESSAGDFRGIEDMIAALDYEGSLPVATVDLMESHRSSKGSRYERLDAVELGEPVGEAAS